MSYAKFIERAKKSPLSGYFPEEENIEEDIYCSEYIDEAELEEWEKGFMKGYLCS